MYITVALYFQYKTNVRKTFCSIDYPFSANKMYAPIGRGQMVKSKQYVNWLEKNKQIVKNNLLPPDEFPIEIQLTVFSNYDWAKKNDVDNLIKPTIDLLVKSEILPDDSTNYIQNVNIKHVWMTGYPMLAITYLPVEK